MENFPNKIKNVALEIYNPKPGTKSIDIRRKLVQLPELAKALNPVEKYVFAASTKTQISEMDDGVLVSKTAQMFRFIAMDVGYIIPQNKNDWAYIQTRLVDILKRYYSYFTLADIKLAFELAISGELDNYLPKDSQGNPDKKHYQQFNFAFFAKILNAYKALRREVIYKAYNVLPSPDIGLHTKNHDAKRYRQNRNRHIFLEYKYTGRLILSITDDMFVYEWLKKCGLADDIQVNEGERKEAFSRYMQRVANGLENKYTAYTVRRQGIKSPEIEFTAFEIARKREIKKAFDRMIAEEMQVDNYLNN